jgi:type IV pilus assembly protein PilM
VYLFNKFDFDTTDLQSEVELRIQTLFNNVLSTFQKVVQFYSNGRTKKTLDAIYVVGGGADVPGIENYIRTYLGSPISVVKSSDEIGEKCKIPQGCDSKFYLNAFGLLLRKE